METRASYTLVGTFVLILMLGGAGFIMWLAKFSSDVRFDTYQMFVSGSVTGLSSDATVRYRGIPVGHVTDIRIAPNDIDKIRITIEVEATTPVRTDTTASVEMQGITGVAYVQLSGGSNDAPSLGPEPGQSVPTIRTEASGLSALFESAPDMINATIRLMDRGSELLSDQNRAYVTDILSDVSQITGQVARNREAISSLMLDAQATLESVRGTSENIEKVSAVLSADIDTLMKDASETLASLRTTLGHADNVLVNAEPEIQATLVDLRATAASIRSTSETAENILENNQASINQFASTGLLELTALITDTRSLVASLTQVAIQLERDPASFLFGGAQSGYQAQ
ncbi:MAG: MCE family protein [Rhodospirillales bacterium]|nr:MCE family protein [Rhodospirillales bacterium]